MQLKHARGLNLEKKMPYKHFPGPWANVLHVFTCTSQISVHAPVLLLHNLMLPGVLATSLFLYVNDTDASTQSDNNAMFKYYKYLF